MLERRAQFVTLAMNRRGASAARQVFIKETSDRPLIDPIQRKAATREPSSKVRDAAQVRMCGTGRVTPLSKVVQVLRSEAGQLTLVEPAPSVGMKGSNLIIVVS